MLGLVVLALLVMGVGSALAVFQYSQDNRSAAAGKACYDPKGFWYDCTPKETEYEKYIRQIQEKLNAERKAKEAAKKNAEYTPEGLCRNSQGFLESCSKSKNTAKKDDKKTPVVTPKPPEKTKAQIDAENVEKARSQQQQNNNGGNNNNKPNPTPAPVSPEVAYTQQIYREMIGSVPPTTDKDFQTNVASVRKNNCLEVVLSFNYNETFKKRKASYSNYQYARMIHRALVARNFDPDNASNGWVKTLDNKNLTRDQLAANIWQFDEPKAVCAGRKLIQN